MILATRFTFIVERSWKNMYFHPKLAWPPATYDVVSRNHSNWASLYLFQNFGVIKQVLKTSGGDVLSSRKKLRNTLWWGGGGGVDVRGLI